MVISPKPLVLKQQMAPEFQIESSSNKPTHCPYCQAKILAGDTVLQCMDCESIYHKDCWEELNKCAMYGCESIDATVIHALPAAEDAEQDGDHDEAFVFVQAAGGSQEAVQSAASDDPALDESSLDTTIADEFNWPPDFSIDLSDLSTSGTRPTHISIDEYELGPRLKCSYCHLDINAGDYTVACRKCNTTHHLDCWGERNRCAVFGCNSRSHTGPDNLVPPRNRPVRRSEQRKPLAFGVDTHDLMDWWDWLKGWFRSS